MDNQSDVVTQVIKSVLEDSFAEELIETGSEIDRVKREYETILRTGIEQLYRAARKEINRWNNFHLWLTARRIDALRDVEKLEEEEYVDKELYSLSKELVQVIDSNIAKAKAKIDALDIDKRRKGKWLIETKIRELQATHQDE